MNERWEKVMRIAETLSSEEQDELASAMMTLMDFRDESQDEPYQLTPEENAALDISLAQADRGELATKAEMEAIWKEYT